MKKLKIITCLAVFVAGLGILPLQGSVIFKGTTWYDSGASADLTASGSMTSMTASGSGSFALTYIPTQTLTTAGQTITYTVDFSIVGPTNGATSNGLRFGLLNSGGNKINADNLGTSNALYANYTGYSTAFGSQSAGNSNIVSALWDRTGSNNALITVSTPYTSNASASNATGSTPAMSLNTPYTMTLTLTYNSAISLTVSSSLTGGTLGTITRSYVDTTPATSFDTIVLYSTAPATSGLTFTNVTVVPEPAPASLLLGAIGLLVVWKSRRLVSAARR